VLLLDGNVSQIENENLSEKFSAETKFCKIDPWLRHGRQRVAVDPRRRRIGAQHSSEIVAGSIQCDQWFNVMIISAILSNFRRNIEV
jgi:hypothetical protein